MVNKSAILCYFCKEQLEHQILGMKKVYSCRNCGHLTLENDLSIVEVRRDGSKICW